MVHRRGPDAGWRNAVSEYPTSAAMRCISSGAGTRSPIQTPAGFPPAGSVVKAASRSSVGSIEGFSPMASRSVDRMDDASIEVGGLVKTFGAVRALDGLDLVVGRGKVHGFLG